MQTINVTALNQNTFELVNNTAKYNEVVTVVGDSGNVVMLSEDDYRSLMETMAINSNPVLRADIIEGMNTPLSECLDESEVEW